MVLSNRSETFTAHLPALLGLVGCLAAYPVAATPFNFNSGNVDGRIATGSRPADAGKHGQ